MSRIKERPLRLYQRGQKFFVRVNGKEREVIRPPWMSMGEFTRAARKKIKSRRRAPPQRREQQNTGFSSLPLPTIFQKRFNALTSTRQALDAARQFRILSQMDPNSVKQLGPEDLFRLINTVQTDTKKLLERQEKKREIEAPTVEEPPEILQLTSEEKQEENEELALNLLDKAEENNQLDEIDKMIGPSTRLNNNLFMRKLQGDIPIFLSADRDRELESEINEAKERMNKLTEELAKATVDKDTAIKEAQEVRTRAREEKAALREKNQKEAKLERAIEDRISEDIKKLRKYIDGFKQGKEWNKLTDVEKADRRRELYRLGEALGVYTDDQVVKAINTDSGRLLSGARSLVLNKLDEYGNMVARERLRDLYKANVTPEDFEKGRAPFNFETPEEISKIIRGYTEALRQQRAKKEPGISPGEKESAKEIVEDGGDEPLLTGLEGKQEIDEQPERSPDLLNPEFSISTTTGNLPVESSEPLAKSPERLAQEAIEAQRQAELNPPVRSIEQTDQPERTDLQPQIDQFVAALDELINTRIKEGRGVIVELNDGSEEEIGFASTKPSRYIGDGQTDEELKRAAQYLQLPGFAGVFMADQARKMKARLSRAHSEGDFDLRTDRFSCIINTKSSDHRGEHWCAIYCDPADEKVIEFYDPIGERPNELQMKFIGDLISFLDSEHLIKLKVNKVQNQKYNTDDCGWFCLKFLHDRYAGVPWEKASGWLEFSRRMKELNDKTTDKHHSKIEDFREKFYLY